MLIGGATTSRTHTAVKIEPHYLAPTIHIVDASRSVGAMNQLTSETLKTDYVNAIREDYEKVRKRHANKKPRSENVPLQTARNNALTTDWQKMTLVKPQFIGLKRLDNYPLKNIIPCIDWTPFFQTWELAGKYPAILEDKIVGKAATQLFTEAKTMLDLIVTENWLTANAVIGLYPANREGDDVHIYADERRDTPLKTFHFLRQQSPKADDKANQCLADLIAPIGTPDYMGFFAVTTGKNIESHLARFEKNNDDYSSILLKALADRLAEAFAEHCHTLVRKTWWGYASDEMLDDTAIIKEQYRGIRPAPGYPACPDHTEKRLLFDLLEAESSGISLTENFAMHPASSVSGFYFSHPLSNYFAVGKISRDQIEDYARRLNQPINTIEKWLSPNLAYEPNED